MNELESLRDQVDQLRDALGVNLKLPSNPFSLTPMEQEIVGLLVKREVADTGMLYAALYSNRHPSELPEDNNIKVYIHKIRRKGVGIKHVRGVGYYLDKGERERLRA